MTHVRPTWGVQKTYCGLRVDTLKRCELIGISSATCPDCVNNAIIATARVGQVDATRKVLSIRQDILTQDTKDEVERLLLVPHTNASRLRSSFRTNLRYE